jgi:ribosome-associated toxin RatA of RatAB toxin-antitoxin module
MGFANRREEATARCSAAILLALATAMVPGAARCAQDVAVEARTEGNALAIDARATIHASLPLIWRTLTDYDHLADFVPGMKTSRVLERRGRRVVVEQTGEAKLLIFNYPIAVVVESEEHYPNTIGVRVLTGNLRKLAGAYRIDAVSGRLGEFVLRWHGIIEPDIPLPLFITAPGLREAVAEQFFGMIGEIERRGTLQANRPPE